MPFSNDKKNGIQKYYNENGILLEEARYINDRRNGITKRYYENGKLMADINYKEDKIDGILKGYYENGKLNVKTPYSSDLVDGTAKVYYENGALKRIAPYKNGKRNGLLKGYYENGKLFYTAPYINGKKQGEEKDYYLSGPLKGVYPFINDSLKGLGKEYYESGKLKSKLVYSYNHDGYATNYKENGDTLKLGTGWYYVADSDQGYKFRLDKTNEFYSINPNPIAIAKDFKTLEVDKSNLSDEYILTMRFNDTATKAWELATGKYIGKKLAFILDNKLLFTPKVNAQIHSGVSALNRGDISKEDLEKIKLIIESEEKK